MSRPVTLTKPFTYGHQSWPAGLTVTLPEVLADEAISRGLGTEAAGATSGSAIVKSGTNSVIVPHNLNRVPNFVCATGTHAEVATMIVTAISSSSFTAQVSGGANTTADRTVYWEVR